jgi:hypothetical protein
MVNPQWENYSKRKRNSYSAPKYYPNISLQLSRVSISLSLTNNHKTPHTIREFCPSKKFTKKKIKKLLLRNMKSSTISFFSQSGRQGDSNDNK